MRFRGQDTVRHVHLLIETPMANLSSFMFPFNIDDRRESALRQMRVDLPQRHAG
jgi:hypothetical protein